ncbi:MAG: HAD family hydrolase [Thaumarchaeota archaeon]|nr:MAG: HAD family hydrolase [Nitrososphaerota archaeon]
MCKPFIFFDLGQTLVDEWDFIAHLDKKFLELLNGFGARIDERNYHAIRDSIIRDRKIGHGGVRELVIEVCKMLSPSGYDKVIVSKLEPDIKQSRRELFRFFDDAESTLQVLSKYCEIGLIANQSEDIHELLELSGLGRFFKVQAISSSVKLKKPDPRIFELALKQAGRYSEDCIMVGDRLDTDICPANTLGITTIRVTDSLFALQVPARECELATYTVTHLSKIPQIVERIIG